MSRPRVLYEASSLLGELTGVGIYARELIAAVATEVDATLFLSASKGETPPFLAGLGAKVARRRFPARGLLWAWDRLRAPRIETLAGDADLVHSLNYSIVPTRRPLVVTIHDLYFLERKDDAARWGGALFARDLVKRAHEAAHVIAVSEATRRDCLERLGLPEEKVTAVPLAPRTDFPTTPAAEAPLIRGDLGVQSRYLLCYGSDDPRKNRGGLLRAYEALRALASNAPELVLVGGAPASGPGVRWFPYLPAVELHALLSGALALVFPSLGEGFGLPAVEALALGVPLAASPVGAIPSIAGDAYVELDPSDPDQMARALSALCEDEALRARLRVEGPKRTATLSWKKTAAATLDVYRNVM